MWYLAGVGLFVVGALCVMVTGALVLDSVPERMRPGLFGELPRRVLLGNSSLRWGCSRSGLFFLPVVLVAQPPPCQGDQYNRERTKAAQDCQEAVVLKDGSGKERTHRNSSPIKGCVQQDGDEHAAFRVVEDPRVHDGQAGGREGIPDDVACGEFIPRRKEQGQVPQAPKGTED